MLEKITAEVLQNLDGNTVSEIIMLTKILEEAEEDVATICGNTHFVIGKTSHAYEANGALGEGIEIKGAGSINIQGNWEFVEELPQHPYSSANAPNTKTYNAQVSVEDVFDLYRANYQIKTGKHNFRDDMIPWLKKRYLLFKDFVKRADSYEFHS